MGSRGSGRKDGWEGGVNFVGLESFLTTLGALLEDAERSKVGKGVRRRGRRRRRWIADIVADAIRDLEGLRVELEGLRVIYAKSRGEP